LTRTRTAKSRARAGDLGDALYIVAHGNVEILASGLRPAEGSGGSGEAITQLGARHVGEMALLSGGPRTATIRAVEDTELMNIGKDDFDHWRVGRARPRRSRHDSVALEEGGSLVALPTLAGFLFALHLALAESFV